MADRENKRDVTKKHLARVERERIQRRNISIFSIAIFAVVILVIGTGIVIEGVMKPQQTIIQVDENIITARDFQSFVKYQRFRLVNEYVSTFQFIQSMGDQSSFSYFESYLMQLQNELQPEVLGQNSINQLIENAFVREEAESLGIQVSQSDVQKMVNEVMFQYYPEGTPTPAPTRVLLPTPTLSALQLTLVPPPPTAIITETEGIEPGVDLEKTDVESSEEVAATPISPTPTVYSEEIFNEDYEKFMDYLKSFAGVSEEDVFTFYEGILLRERLAEEIITDLPTEEEKLWARHILFRDEENGEEEALVFLSRLEAGEDFKIVAEELSSDEDNAESLIFEDLGWFGVGDMVEPFEDAARELKIGEFSQPVNTSFGWHVIQLLGRDVQPLEQSDIDQIRLEKFQEWLDNKRVDAVVEIDPDWITVVPLEPDIPEAYKLPIPE
jgi:peptidyl-prolyl cis-trans isomerase D